MVSQATVEAGEKYGAEAGEQKKEKKGGHYPDATTFHTTNQSIVLCSVVWHNCGVRST
jgi:hypothetical protein